MTTPTEEEARAEAERLWPLIDGLHERNRAAGQKQGAFIDGVMWAASRVSTPPSEPRPSPIGGEYVAGPMGQAIRESTATSGSTAYPDALGYVEQAIYANEDSSLSVTWTNAEVLEMLGDIADRLTVTARATPPTDEDEREALIQLIWGDADAIESVSVEAAADAILAAGFRRQVPSTPAPRVFDVWEYGERGAVGGVWRIEPHDEPALWAHVPAERRVRRRKAGPWEPVPTEGEA